MTKYCGRSAHLQKEYETQTHLLHAIPVIQANERMMESVWGIGQGLLIGHIGGITTPWDQDHVASCEMCLSRRAYYLDGRQDDWLQRYKESL